MANVALQAGIGIALSLAAGYLLQDSQDSPIVQGTGPSPTVERGTPINLLIGRERVGPIYTWYGSRSSETESAGGGKGFGGEGTESEVWFEEGWHILCIGPARRLWKIIENGKTVYGTPMDPASHPSGTSVDLGTVGTFVIYWGEADQPENTELGEPGKLTEDGISSRWPYLCYIHWTRKRLGTTAVWPRLTYDLEVWPFDSKLVATPPFFAASRTLVGDAIDVVNVLDGAPGVNYLDIDDNTTAFKASQWCQILGQTIPDGDYQIDHVSKPTPDSRRIFLAQSITGLTAGQGTIQAYRDEADDGANAAHILYQLLFARMPHGRGLDPLRWDIASLEELGVTCQQENLRFTLLANSEKTTKSAVADLLQDVGAMVYQDPVSGLNAFRVIRESTEIATIPSAVLTGHPPEIHNVVESEEPASRKLFTFKDRLRDYLTFPITIDDDGKASIDQIYGRDTIQMSSVRDLVTAWTVAKRRNQESYSGDMPVTFRANREAAMLCPGRQVAIPDLDMALLVMSLTRKDSLSGEVEIEALPNYYGVPVSAATVYDGGGLAPDVEESAQDLEVIPFEVPQRLNATGAVRGGVARIRNSSSVSSATIHLSADDISYFPIAHENGVHTGGKLDVAVVADGPSILDPGPTFLAEGPDIEQALDLSDAGSLNEWQLGRQVCVVGDGLDKEIWFVRWVESMGGGQYRLREVLRKRYCTTKQAWPIGTPLILFEVDDVGQFTDLIMAPQESVFVKSQPIGNAPLGLADIESEELALYGQGVRPLPVTGLRATDTIGTGANAFYFPNNPAIRWGYRAAPGPSNACPATLPAGDPIFARPPCDGSVRLRLTDPNNGDALLRQVDLPLDQTGEYEYDIEDLLTDFGLGLDYLPNTNGRFYLRTGAASPTPTNPTLTFSTGGSAGTGDFSAFTPATLSATHSGSASATMTVPTNAGRMALWVTAAGVPGLTAFPTGTWNVRLKITAVTGGGASFQPIVAWIVRLNSSNAIVEQHALNEDDGNPVTGALIKTWSGTISSWTAGASTDRLGLVIGPKDNGGGSTDIVIEVDSGESYIENTGLVAPLLPFDVEATIVKGSQQSTLETISVANPG